MNNVNLLETYCKVAELGSFSKAALYLKQPKSRVSRAISRLEESLETQLIRRTTRKFSLTDSGELLLQRVRPLLLDLHNELNQVTANSNEVSGIINITAPEDLGLFLLDDIVKKFFGLYPNVGINLRITNDYVDFAKENIDLGFRIGKLKDSSLVQYKLAEFKLGFVASKEYTERHGVPIKRSDLRDHRLLLFLSEKGPTAFGAFGELPENAFSCSSFPLIYKMIKQGQGVGVLPDFLSKEDISNGTFCQVASGWSSARTNLHLIYPQSKNLSKKIRTFVDFSKDYFKSRLL